MVRQRHQLAKLGEHCSWGQSPLPRQRDGATVLTIQQDMDTLPFFAITPTLSDRPIVHRLPHLQHAQPR